MVRPMKGYAVVLSLFCPVYAQSQSVSYENTGDSALARNNAEFMFDYSESDDGEKERLRWLLENPFDLNRITREELQTIPGVLPADADAVLLMRRRIRRFASVYQLAILDSVDGLVEKLAPYVRVEEGRASGVSRYDIRTRMTTRYGANQEETPDYLGSSSHWYNRVTFSIKEDLSGSVLFEKDAGERPSDGFVSGFVQAQRVAGLVDVTVGDFTVESGQGLVLWGGSGFAKGSAGTGSVWRRGIGIRPYRSKDEFHFMRGVAASTSVPARPGEMRLALFLSTRSLAGRRESSGEITSLYETGLFRTEGEQRLAHSVRERVVGGRMELRTWNGWIFGMTGYHSRFSNRLVAGRSFEFGGISAGAGSIDVMLKLDGCTLFGEAAYSGGGTFAVLMGMAISAARTRVSLVFRDYGVGFQSLHANGFGENGATKNERGLYLSFRITPAQSLVVSAYVDLFRFPWRTFGNPLPSSGLEAYLQTDVRLSKESSLSLRYARKETERVLSANDDLGRSTAKVVDQKRERGRITVETRAIPSIRLRGRLEVVDISYGRVRPTERGVLLYQDIALTFNRWASVHYRIAFFETASYESRVYEYENDVRGAYANPALFGRGKRWYLLGVFHPIDAVHVSAKYALTQKDEGSQPRPDQSLSLQVDLRF